MMRARPDILFFFAACGLVAGAALGGLGLTPIAAVIISALLLLAIFFVKVQPIIILIASGFFFIGNIYYAIDDYSYHKAQDAIENIKNFEGMVVDDPRRSLTAQTIKIRLIRANNHEALSGRVYIRTALYPEISYGDILRISGGTIVPPPFGSYGNYMAKERVHGTLFNPEIEILRNEGNFLFSALFDFKRLINEHIDRMFTHQHAAFLSGILLGDKDEFSPEFSEKLSASGTMHLMALSGLNMTIIVFVAIAVFSILFGGRRRSVFIATFVTVALFVAMTGFQVSAVRAALMAFIVGLASLTHKIYSPHNAIALAALIITLWNPKSPTFDLGFQLSFLATMSIIYFSPVLKRLPPLQSSGIMGWRDALTITLAAQLGVAPITIINFGNFSFTALLSNIGILAVIPLLTVAGLLVVFVSITIPQVAFIISKPISFLIDYVMTVIETFAVVYVPFNPQIGIITASLYYCLMIWICYRWSPKDKKT